MAISSGKIYATLTDAGKRKIHRDIARAWKKTGKRSADWWKEELARAASFRRATFNSMEVKRLEPNIGRALQLASNRTRLHVIDWLFDSVRTEMRDALLKELAEETVADAEALSHSINDLSARWSIEDLWLCASVRAHLRREESKRLQPIQQELERRLEESRGTAVVHAPAEEETHVAAQGEESLQSPEFTTLDQLLIRSVVSALNDVERAPNLDKLDDLIGELQAMDDERERSWFHRGFLDALLGRKLRNRQQGDNAGRRAWYVTGHLLAQMRSIVEIERPQLLRNLDQKDREDLLNPKTLAAAQLLPELLRPLLVCGDVDTAKDLIKSHGKHKLLRVAMDVREWAHDTLVDPHLTGSVRGVLDVVDDLFRDSAGESEEISSAGIHFEIKRLSAVALRMDRQFRPADQCFEKLLRSKDLTEMREADLHAQRALIKMEVDLLENFKLREEGDARVALLESLNKAQDDFKQAARGPAPSPIALFALALPVVAEPKSAEPGRGAKIAEAIERLNTAIDMMRKSSDEVWKKSKMLQHAEFYAALLRLRNLESVDQVAIAQVLELLKSNVRFPADLELDAVYHATLMETPETEEAAVIVLNRYERQALEKLPLRELAKSSADFRRALTALLEKPDQSLKPRERWNAWRALLDGANRADQRDVETASVALDALESLARESKNLSPKFLQLLEKDDGDWSPAWDERAREVARYTFYDDRGDTPQAIVVLTGMAYAALREQRQSEVEDLIELLKEKRADDETLKSLRQQRGQKFGNPEPDEAAKLALRRKVSVLFVGGNETQEGHKEKLERELAEADDKLKATYKFTNWSSNWGREIDALENKLSRHDAVVLMEVVRTGLGCKMRKLASKHHKPWVSCTGRGRQSMKRAILEAARVARNQLRANKAAAKS